MIACQSCSSPASSLGGKNSKENDRSPALEQLAACSRPRPVVMRQQPRTVARRGPDPSTAQASGLGSRRERRWDPAGFRDRVQEVLDEFLDEQAEPARAARAPTPAG